MKYTILDLSKTECKIELTPETETEELLIKNAQSDPDAYKSTFLLHYQSVLEIKVHKNAVLVALMEDSIFPSLVSISYRISRSVRK